MNASLLRMKWLPLTLLPLAGFLAGRLSMHPADSGDSPEKPEQERHASYADRTSSSRRSASSGGSFGPEAARKILASFSRESLRDDAAAMLRMNDQLNTSDPAALTEIANEIFAGMKDEGTHESSRFFHDALVTVLHRLSDADPALAVKLLAGARDIPSLSDEWQLVFSNYALRDAAAAQAALAGLQGDELRAALEGVMSALNGHDPDAAMNLVRQYPDSQFDNERDKLVEKLVLSDPRQACQAAEEMVRDGRDPKVFLTLLQKWFTVDKGAALDWAEAYEGPGASLVKAAYFSQIVKTDPERAASGWSSLADLSPKEQARMADMISGSLASQDPAKARQWAEQLPEGPAKTSAIASFIDRWSRSDASAASSYLSTLPEGPVRDSAAAKYASAINRQYPADAFYWTSTLPEGVVKERVMDEVMNGWRQDDPAAAEKAWAEYSARLDK